MAARETCRSSPSQSRTRRARASLGRTIGNDPVEAVQKHEKPFTFVPAGKLWFVGNPTVRS